MAMVYAQKLINLHSGPSQEPTLIAGQNKWLSFTKTRKSTQKVGQSGIFLSLGVPKVFKHCGFARSLAYTIGISEQFPTPEAFFACVCVSVRALPCIVISAVHTLQQLWTCCN